MAAMTRATTQNQAMGAVPDTSTLATRAPSGSGIPGNTITPQGSGMSDAYSSDSTLQNLKQQQTDLTNQRNKAYASGGAAVNQDLENKYNDVNNQVSNQLQQDHALQPFYNLQNQQKQRYDKFRMQFPSIVDNIMAPQRVQARQGIAQGVNQNNANFNSRGLLYSGLRAGGANDVVKGVASDLSGQQAQANQTVQDEGNQLENQAAQTGLAAASAREGYATTDNSSRQAILDALMEQSQQQDKAIGNLVGAGGGLLGTAAGAAVSGGGGSNGGASDPTGSGSMGNKYSLGVPGLPAMPINSSMNIAQMLAKQFAPQGALASR